MLSGIGFLAGIVENVVNQLECRSKVHAIVRQSALDFWSSAAKDSPQLRRSLEQLGSFVADNL